jgi:hypothetical protein
MDYHRQFRADSLKTGSSFVGRPRFSRITLGSAGPARRRTGRAPNPPARPARAAGTQRPEESPPGGAASRSGEDAAKVRAQVKQLHFWLKVFSRFCQDGPEQD